MFIAIIGTRCSGKSLVKNYLVEVHGFTEIRVIENGGTFKALVSKATTNFQANATLSGIANNLQRVSNPRAVYQSNELQEDDNTHIFSSASHLLDFVTRNWRSNYVARGFMTQSFMDVFIKRPFFMIIYVDAPLLLRFNRAGSDNLEEFVKEDDRVVFHHDTVDTTSVKEGSESLSVLRKLATLDVYNSFSNVPALHTHLNTLDMTNSEHLRPHWDTYFMTLAALASRRSNCMKRRVGAILVRNHRIVATGYNGTPRGLPNCNEGGCRHCNMTLPAGTSDECLCLHAEENALLEAGRERVGDGGVLYCNTCPCLKCTIKIIQTGVKEVVYNLSYKMDDESAKLLHHAGVELRRHALLS